MKKIISFLIATAFSAMAMAQIGAHAGANISTFSGNTKTVKNKVILGYQLGFMKDFSTWGDRFSIEPGVSLIHNGGNMSDVKTHLNYLQVPVNTKIHFYFDGFQIFMGYGIYASCGLWGSTKTGKTKTELEFGKNDDIRRFDVGGQVFIGGVMGRYGANFTFQHGARDLWGLGILNRSYQVNFTYLFSEAE